MSGFQKSYTHSNVPTAVNVDSIFNVSEWMDNIMTDINKTRKTSSKNFIILQVLSKKQTHGITFFSYSL